MVLEGKLVQSDRLVKRVRLEFKVLQVILELLETKVTKDQLERVEILVIKEIGYETYLLKYLKKSFFNSCNFFLQGNPGVAGERGEIGPRVS